MAERVIPWQDEQCPVIRRDPVQQFQRLLHIAGIISVRQHDTFRICGGARSIGNIGQRVGGYQFCPFPNYIRIFPKMFSSGLNHLIEENLVQFQFIDGIEKNIPFHGL
ncbi:MAG: hypothetical protein BWZ06_01767 [Bacteroidetes bacterium ADurb.BinA261]|nr:MAG: hypothetical protein BWZ06_01767 [Bacteroidetes bacterium ADurb.BinA261]